MKTIFVTGGTGFLGAYLLRYLVKQGAGEIRALKRKNSSMDLVGDAAEHVKWFNGDLLDTISLEEAMEGVDEVYHCGAMVSFDLKELDQMNRVNVEGTANVVNIALDFGIKKLIHISSIAAIGRNKIQNKLSETSKWERSPFNSNYAISKYLAEQEVWRGVAEGLTAAVLNPAVILGAGYWGKGGSVGIFEQVWKGLKFYTPGKTAFVDVRDVARMAIQLMESEIVSERFIVTSENWPYKDLFINMALGLDKKPPSIEANDFLRGVAWRMDWLRAKLTGGKRFITKELAQHSGRTFHYENQKSLDLLNFKYIPLQETITDTCKVMKASKAAGKDFGVLDI